MRILKGSLRALKSCLEARLGHRIPVGHALVSWLVTFSADVRTFRVKDPSGRSAYQHVKGRPFTIRLLNFGETSHFKVRSREPMHDQRFDTGVFMGICKATGQYVVFCKGEVKHAMTLRTLVSTGAKLSVLVLAG